LLTRRLYARAGRGRLEFGAAHVNFIALNIAIRCSRIGSFCTLLWLSKTIVGRLADLNGGQRGNLEVFGSPLLANAIQASLTLSARAGACGLPAVNREAFRLSNANGISIV
jgi:hypothetical protein